ncbi:hypothetical protein ATI61_102606 [Archangium gephyra]|uniref:Outer membrane protein n=1 Tax=Archangium gephyra TaxID=48 RepID=A0AAC8QD39_9BACT|nr:hypothetical protein [Archangium gephyra]AKJ05545.1 Hypothetical protein AA314_07171 [Archangium gephyra]REG36229.1 hypothetical protein ATI61_102606 [Archangium gephyra]
MWKQGFAVLAVLLLGLGSGSAEARFGKRPPSSPSAPSSPSSPGPSHPSSGVGVGRPRYNPYYGPGYYGFYGDPWARYYYDPSWAWPYMGPGRPFIYGRYYDLAWRRRMMPPPSAQAVPSQPSVPTRVDLMADAGFVSQGYAVALGLQADGEQLAFGARLNLFNLATDDGSPGRDTLTLLSLKPGVVLVSREDLRVRLLAGVDVAFAPDATFVGPGLGASTLMRVAGPLKLEASAHWTVLPFTQLSGEAGLALELGPVRLRGGYRATYLDDQGRLDPDGIPTRDLFTGPYVGVALMP